MIRDIKRDRELFVSKRLCLVNYIIVFILYNNIIHIIEPHFYLRRRLNN